MSQTMLRKKPNPLGYLGSSLAIIVMAVNPRALDI